MKVKTFWLAFVACFLFSQFALAQSLPVARTAQRMAARPVPPSVQMVAAYAKLPMSFEPNQGQVDNRVKFLSRGRGYTLFLTADEAVLALKSKQKDGASAIRMRLFGANSRPRIAGVGELPGTSNYFVGNDPKRWRARVPSYERVKYSGVYPGIDLVFHGAERNLEFDFSIAPGANPHIIQLDIRRARTRIDDDGDLMLVTHAGEIRLKKPLAYQMHGTEKEIVSARYRCKGKRVVLDISRYDRAKPLIIDPVLAYSTYLGGSGLDIGQGIAVDTAGNAYITGHTTSLDFPTNDPLQPTNGGGLDIFVSKINATGSALVYSTYLGGSRSSYDDAGGIAVDSSGNVYVTGSTDSPDFPTTFGAFQTSIGFRAGSTPIDAYVTKLSAAGNALVYSTYLGGTGEDHGLGIAVDSSGNAYLTGWTTSTDFPTLNPMQPNYGGGIIDAFVTKLNSTGSALVYSTYLGGSLTDQSVAIAVDAAGNAYVVGSTASLDFPTANALQPACALQVPYGSCSNAFVAKLNAAGSTLVYSTYLGGGTPDASGAAGSSAKGVAVDGSGSAYVVGETTALDFPTVSPLQAKCAVNSFGDCGDIFITKFNSAGSALLYSTYLGGTAGEDAAFGAGIAADASGNAYVTGMTGSVDFPTANALQPQSGGGVDAFVATLNPSGTALVYSSYLGGGGTDDSRALTLDAAGNAYITGTTDSTNFPLANALQSANMGGGGDVFIAKISGIAGQPGIAVTPTQITFQPTLINTTSAPVTVAVNNPGTATLLISDISTQDPFKLQNFSPNIVTGIAPSASGSFDVTFSPTGAGPNSGSVTITSNVSSSGTTIPLQGSVIMTGTIAVTTNTPSATFSLTGPTTFSGSGMSATFNNAPIGTYTITFGPVDGYITPPSQIQTLPAGGSVSFSGTYILFSPPPPRFALVDPVPSLLSGPGVSTDPNLLATGGRRVVGVAADGVTQIVFRFSAQSVGQRFSIAILNDQRVQSASSDEDGGLARIGDSSFQGAGAVTVTAVNTTIGPMAFAIYRAPVDFPRPAGTDAPLVRRSEFLQVRSINTPGYGFEMPIEVLRPPVVLVHGLWSDRTAWDFFSPLFCPTPTATCPDVRFTVFRADYKPTNAAGFMVNAAVVLPQLLGSVALFKHQSMVAAIQADVVAHSMGGDVIRAMVLGPSFLNVTNYQRGVIHKLITIDTPHRGSEFAANLLNTAGLCHSLFNKIGLGVDAGAIRDLSVGSDALTLISATKKVPLRAHMIVGIASIGQTLAAEGNLVTFATGTLCPSVLPLGGFPIVFNGQLNDLIVSERSQEAQGLAFEALGLPTPVSAISRVRVPAIHTIVHPLFDFGPDVLSRDWSFLINNLVAAQSGTPQLVIDELNQPLNGDTFTSIRP